MAGLLGGQRTQGNLASALQGYTPPQMIALTNPQVMDYARNVAQSAQQNLQTQMSDLDKALVMGQQGVQVGDREALARLMEQVPGLMGATAFHGSPYRFDKFDPTKVGAGEGAQVYGHGMYFAEHPAVAMPYSKIVPSGMSATPNRQLFGKDVEPMTAEYKVSQLVDEMGVAKAKKFVADWAKDPLPDQVSYVDNLQSIMSKVAKKSDVKNLGASNIYKVDIPDEKIPKMLNWDIPLSEQSKAVQDIAWKYKDALKNQTEMKGLKNIWELDGADLYGVMQRYKMEDSGKLVKQNVDIKDVSDIMNKSDIPGIRYMNYQGKTSEGANTSNFVVFDPTDVKILERNKKTIEGLLD
jgi:hypothetical protein